MVSLLSALEIQRNNTRVISYGSEERGHGFAIIYGSERKFRVIISSNPAYETGREAQEAGETLMKEIKSLDLSREREGLVEAMGGSEVAKAVEEVVEKSKEVERS